MQWFHVSRIARYVNREEMRDCRSISKEEDLIILFMKTLSDR